MLTPVGTHPLKNMLKQSDEWSSLIIRITFFFNYPGVACLKSVLHQSVEQRGGWEWTYIQYIVFPLCQDCQRGVGGELRGVTALSTCNWKEQLQDISVRENHVFFYLGKSWQRMSWLCQENIDTSLQTCIIHSLQLLFTLSKSYQMSRTNLALLPHSRWEMVCADLMYRTEKCDVPHFQCCTWTESWTTYRCEPRRLSQTWKTVQSKYADPIRATWMI